MRCDGSAGGIVIFKIAIVDDDGADAAKLANLTEKYFAGSPDQCEIKIFSGAVAFCENFRADFDVIFFDISMPDMSGMDAARFIRERDKRVVIVFVTNMVQCAIEGYTVQAFDFIVKPINEGSFDIKFDRILGMVRKVTDDGMVTLNTTDGMKRIAVRDIKYIEVRNHHLTYHTADGEFLVRGTISAAEKELTAYTFGRCNSCYLVNMKHITDFGGDWVTVGGDKLKVSQTKKQSFLGALAKYFGGGAC